MFNTEFEIAPERADALIAAAERAVRAIPPAFPLDATVAVNPFLGQVSEDLAKAGARLSRVAGAAVARPRRIYAAQIAEGRITDADLGAALDAETSRLKPANIAALKAAVGRDRPAPEALPTVAELAAEATGIDWPSVITKTFGLWAGGHFDRGQALWTPAPGHGAYQAWQAWATHDLTPEIAGLTGFCQHAASAPDTAQRAMLRACETLSISEAAAETVFHRLLMDLGGWSQHARWLLWQAELAGGTDVSVGDLLAIRLVFEEAVFNATPQVELTWRDVAAAHEAPVAPDSDDVIDAVLQAAAERAHQRRLEAALDGGRGRAGRPALQAAFCIDVRSEVFRRALEAQSGDIETIGFAGFFGLPLSHTAHGSDIVEAHLPVLLNPGLSSTGRTDEEADHKTRIRARAARAWGRFKQAAVSSFAFIESAGLLYGGKLVKDALGLTRAPSAEPQPHLTEPLSAEAKADTAAAVLKAMSLTDGFAPVVLLLGHGGQVTNNPHESAYHCGACGGYTGEVSARTLAALLNDPEARAGLASRGVIVPDDTVFVAGLHETTTDAVTLYDTAGAPDLSEVRAHLEAAGKAARIERSARLPGATPQSIAARARDWAEVRPEWGLAGCSAFIAAPRTATAGADLQGRSFLHSYDWKADEGFGTLELILTAPVVVASWISLQYYGSSVAPEAFGGGNKLIHNVVGGFGVVQGNGGRLRPGLPWQAVHDGEDFAHEPLRLSVCIEAPQQAILDILDKHGEVRALFDQGWLHLFALEGGRMTARYRPGLRFEAMGAQTAAA